jgi:hypothetical protein
MTQEMNLLYIKSTGHVIAAFTRNGETTQPETKADAFVGGGLHLRGFGDAKDFYSQKDFNEADLAIPATEIGIFRTGYDNTILNAPFTWQLINLDTTPALSKFNNAKPSLPTTPVTPAPNPTLILKLTGSVIATTKVLFVLVAPSPADPTATPSKVDPPSPTQANQTMHIPLPASLASGEYYSLVFLAGYPACVLPFKIP